MAYNGLNENAGQIICCWKNVIKYTMTNPGFLLNLSQAWHLTLKCVSPSFQNPQGTVVESHARKPVSLDWKKAIWSCKPCCL